VSIKLTPPSSGGGGGDGGTPADPIVPSDGTQNITGDLGVSGSIAVGGTVDGRDVSTDGTNLTSHISNTSNPHSTTASQVGNTVAQWNASQIQGQSISSDTPGAGQLLTYSGGAWKAQGAPASSGLLPMGTSTSKVIVINPNDASSADDANLNTPFKTFSGALSQIPSPTTIDQTWTVLIAPGDYTGNATIAGGAKVALVGMGNVNYASTLTVTVDDTKQFNVNGQYLSITTLSQSMPTVPDLDMGVFGMEAIILAGEGGGIGSIFLHLENVRMTDGIGVTSTLSSFLFAKKCEFVQGITHTNMEIEYFDHCYVATPSVKRVNHATFSEFAGLTVTQAGNAGHVPPFGFFGCNITGTFTGPANSARFDALTNYNFVANGAALAGGATKLITENDGQHPTSSTDLAIAKYSGTAGVLQNSGVTISAANHVTVPGGVTASGQQVATLGHVQKFTKQQYSEVVTLTYGSNIAVDVSLSNVFEVTLTSTSGTLANPTNIVKGMSFTVIINQDTTGGRALGYGSFYDFGSEGGPSLVAQASGVQNILSCFVLNSTQVAATMLRGFA
jgi:hypothetical protein